MKNKLYTTNFIINKKKIISNLDFFKKHNKTTKIIAMIKANAYGHGDVKIAKILEKENIYMLGVADFEEGIRLRKKNIKSRIIVTNPAENNIKEILKYKMEPCIYNFKTLKKIININLKNTKIHLKFNTGMNRFGFDKKDINNILKTLNKNIYIKSIFSHLANTEEQKSDLFSKNQIKNFIKIKNIFTKKIKYKINYHIYNTEGSIRFKNEKFNIIRIGIGLYGYTKINKNISSIGELQSQIIQIREINKNDSVGYKRKFIANKKMKIGIIPLGYADGIKRGRMGQFNFIFMLFLFSFYINKHKYITLTLISVFLLLFINYNWNPKFNQRINATINNIKLIVSDINTFDNQRWYFANTSLKLIKNKPFLGHGTGSFANEFAQHSKISEIFIERGHKTPHNYYLYVLFELGFFGLMFLFLFFYYQVFFYLKQKKKLAIYFCVIPFIIMCLGDSYLISHNTLILYIYLSFIFSRLDISSFYSFR